MSSPAFQPASAASSGEYDKVPALSDLRISDEATSEQRNLIARAWAFAEKAHLGQSRASGAPYFAHVAHVGLELAKVGLDPDTIAAGLLHDVVEDTDISIEKIEKEFGASVAHLVEGVTNVSARMAPAGAEEMHAENLRRMMIAVARDLRVLLIKLADRLHNIRTLSYLPEAKQRRVASETMEVYAPLATRLGIGRWKWELEDRCMSVLYPNEFSELSLLMARSMGDREARLEEARQKLDEKLKQFGISGEVKGRNKHLWSTFQKMLRQNKKFDELYDLVALRVVVKNLQDCYATLGLIHSLWSPLPGRVKDYIAMPKTNMYQSLHTTVIGPLGQPMEVQVRTDDMHRTAERGIAAHWSYKEGKAARANEALPFLRSVMEWHSEGKEAGEFVEMLKVDLYDEEVFVFTPKGEVKALPRGATCIDFAYAVHSGVGDHCYGAIVNGKMAPLRHELVSGDIVKVLAGPNHQPNKDWLHIAITSKAKTRIRRWLRLHQREAEAERGRSHFVRAAKRYDIPVDSEGRSDEMQSTARELGFEHLEELYAALGAKEIDLRTVIDHLRPPADTVVAGKVQAQAPARRPQPTAVASVSQGVVIKGVSGLLVTLARCCGPLHGDPILGYITVGRGVSVHRTDCVNAPDLFRKSERLVEVQWADQAGQAQTVEIEVTAFDRAQLLGDMLAAIAKTSAVSGQPTGISAASASASTGPDKMAQGRFTVQVQDLDHLRRLMLSLYQVDGVISVKRREKRMRRRGPDDAEGAKST